MDFLVCSPLDPRPQRLTSTGCSFAALLRQQVDQLCLANPSAQSHLLREVRT